MRVTIQSSAKRFAIRHSRESSIRTFSRVTGPQSCEEHIQKSPFNPISSYKNIPIPEFVTKKWKDPLSKNLNSKVAIRDGYTGQSRTFQDYYNDMSFIAANLKDNFGVGGINESTTVALYCPNHVDFVPICLATALIGVKLTPVNPLFKKDELTTILDRSQSKVLICHHTTLETALESMKQSKTVEHLIVIPKYDDDEGTVPVEGTHNFVSSLKKKHKNPIFETDPKVLLQDLTLYPHLLPYSSGTTGTPKGVCLSHTNLVANLMQIEAVEKVGFPSNHKLICPLPFFHIYGCVVSALYTAWQGQELITMSGRFDLRLFSQLVEKHQPHRAHLVPPILIQLAKSPIVDKYDLSSISMIWSSAAPLSKETAEAVTNRIGCNIKQAWGMSELSPLGTLNSDSNSRQGAIGQLIPSTSGKVVDPKTNENLGPGQTGELMIKGPQVMMGYWNDPVKTSETISSDGWLKTGDVAKYDKDGFFYITDRLKELIKVRGFQVAPAELEALLLTHPSISDAAVIPIDDEYSGELPRAYISLVKQKEQEESSQRLTEMDVQKWVKERVAPYKRLEGGVEFIDVVPKSPSGKILRRLLKDKYRCEMMKKE